MRETIFYGIREKRIALCECGPKWMAFDVWTIERRVRSASWQFSIPAHRYVLCGGTCSLLIFYLEKWSPKIDSAIISFIARLALPFSAKLVTLVRALVTNPINLIRKKRLLWVSLFFCRPAMNGVREKEKNENRIDLTCWWCASRAWLPIDVRILPNRWYQRCDGCCGTFSTPLRIHIDSTHPISPNMRRMGNTEALGIISKLK